MAAAAALPKRTVFADVSNTNRASNTVLDDSLLPQKPALKVLKENVGGNVQMGAPLQKPAQRPISVSSIKGFFSNLGAQHQPNAAAKRQPVAGGVEGIAQVAQPIKTLARKSTTIFREPEQQPVIAREPATNPHVLRKSSITGQPAELQKQAHAADTKFINPVSNEAYVVPTEHVQEQYFEMESTDVRSDGASLIDSAPLPPTGTGEEGFNPLPTINPLPAIIQPHPTRPVESLPLPNKVERRSASSGLASYTAPPEHWEAEQYMESEGDYTTARSLKSRGECTTNQTTIILAPRMTAAAEQEIAEANLFVQQSQEASELEEDEAWDTSMVAEYSEEIFSYMRNMEEQMRPNPHYMDNQTEVQWSMRSVLMDWLVQVHHRFSLLPETLFLCVNYVDRFLSCKVVSLGKLQLVGATAIFVAAKYEEINCPSVQEIVYMVDGGYSTDEILKAERFMLSMLQFELGWPGPMSFLRRISKADDYDLETRTLAKYFMEFTIMDERFVGCIPSYTAAGAHCLARLMLDKGIWVSQS